MTSEDDQKNNKPMSTILIIIIIIAITLGLGTMLFIMFYSKFGFKNKIDVSRAPPLMIN